MIARIWKGIVPSKDKDSYYRYLQKTGLEEYASTPGNRGVWVLRRILTDAVEFTLISLWHSYDAIRAFAGDDFEKAVYYPEDRKFLLEMSPRVEHYEVLAGPPLT